MKKRIKLYSPYFAIAIPVIGFVAFVTMGFRRWEAVFVIGGVVGGMAVIFFAWMSINYGFVELTRRAEAKDKARKAVKDAWNSVNSPHDKR